MIPIMHLKRSANLHIDRKHITLLIIAIIFHRISIMNELPYFC